MSEADDTLVLVKFEYTGATGQKVGFGLVETGQVYAVPEDGAAILEADADFKKLAGKAAEEAEALPGWPEPPTQPAVAEEAPSVEEQAPASTPLDQQIIAHVGSQPTLDQKILAFVPPAPAARGRRPRRSSTSKK